MIKYIGSKRVLAPALADIVNRYDEMTIVMDVFSGTARCSHTFKRDGRVVLANDHNAFAYALALCYVVADSQDVTHIPGLIDELNALPGKPGYFTDTFCTKSRFFQPHNGARVDAMREKIEEWDVDQVTKAVLLVSLMEAADRVDSTCGLQMAYLKKWAPRSYKPIDLRMPFILPRTGECGAYQMEALDFVRDFSETADIAYIDPPYNQHSYLSNYHIWESLVLWDKPEVYGVACKRVDCQKRKSDYNSKLRSHNALKNLVAAVKSKIMIVSFNDEGFVTPEQMVKMLSPYGEVSVTAYDSKRYVGAQIGIYNPDGRRVGEISHTKNQELVFVVDRR